MQLSIVIPCYNEEASIPRLLAALDASRVDLTARGHDVEVIVVDDGSKDGSVARLKEGTGTRAWLRLIAFRRNFGQTAAMAAGIRAATGEVIIPMDADLQNDPVDIPRLLERLDHGYDVVSGWRRKRQDGALTRRLPSFIANWIIGRVSGVRLHDYGCTLKAYRRGFVESLALYGEMHRFIPIYAAWSGARVTELEVSHHPRREGQSKYGLMRTFKVMLDLVTVKFLGDFSTKPLYFFGGMGFALCGAGTMVALVTLAQKFFSLERTFVHRNPLFIVAVFLFMIGVQFVMMGLIAELQIRTYHESQGKPVYVIGETVNLPAPAGASASSAAHRSS